jgi:L-lactate dehydrogenase (cytochrome)
MKRSISVFRAKINRISSYEDARAKARYALPRGLFDYIDGGAEGEYTMRRNVEAFEELVWRPRQALYHEHIDTATEVLGTKLTMPVMTAPCGGMRLVHPEGDIGLVKASANFGICHIASAVSGFPLEEISAAHPGPKWFQLYRLGSRPLMEALVHRAQAAGFGAMVVTVDSVMAGYREKDYRNGFSYDMRINAKNMARLAPQVVTRPRWLYQYWRDGMPFEISNTRPITGGEALPISAMGRTDLSHSPTWDDIDWIRANWTGPMVVKGIMGAEDARRAVDAGADGIVVSNHGGRQLEGAPATIDVLPEIVAEIGGETTILLDSGVRRANDVARAVALGADAVLIGRMSVYGLALGGEAGVTQMLQHLHQELVRTLRLLGVGSIHELDPSFIHGALPGRAAPNPSTR